MTSPLTRHALALDFGRVLTLDPDRSAFAAVQARAGLDPEAFQGAYAARRHDYDRGDIDAGTYWTGILNACRPGISASECRLYLSALIDADFQSWARPRTALHRIVEGAIDRGTPTAIVSNMPAGVGDRFVTSWPWLKKIEHRFFSAEFGLVKPDEDFYQHVLNQTGWEPRDVLFVDDLDANVETASRLGFETLRFTGSPEDLDRIAGWCGVGSRT